MRNCRLSTIKEKELKETCSLRSAATTLVGQPDKPLRLRLSGSTIQERLEICNLSIMEETSILEFSHASLEHGCELSNIGYALAGNGGSPCKHSRCKPTALGCLTFEGASVAGKLSLAGIRIDAFAPDAKALNCEELRLKGSLVLRYSGLEEAQSSDQPCDLHGELSLRGANIESEVVLSGARMRAKWAQITLDPPNTLTSYGAKIGGSMLFWPDHSKPERHCEAWGQINLVRCHINGDLQMFGRYHAINHTRAVNAKSSKIGGVVQFGWLSNGDRSLCEIYGEVDFSSAQIGGKFIASGAKHKLARDEESSILKNRSTAVIAGTARNETQRWKECAVKLRNATVEDDIVFQGTQEHPCLVQGLGLTGTTTKGRFIVEGVLVEALDERCVRYKPNTLRKAISANGATIRGGVHFSESAQIHLEGGFDHPSRCVLDGDVRLRNTTINGPVLFRGVELKTHNEVALWASNSTFGSDVIFEPPPRALSTEAAVTATGEIRLWGAKIQGNLRFEGGTFHTRGSGSAIDLSLTEVSKSLYIGEASEFTFQPGLRFEIMGLLNLNYVTCAQLTIGSNPPETKTDRIKAPCLELTGALLLRETKVRGPVVVSEVKLRPFTELTAYEDKARKRLQELSIFRSLTVVHAIYAELGSRLFVRLHHESHGLINLYGAKTGTVGALRTRSKSSNNEPVDENWGEVPKQKSRWYRAGKPDERATRPFILLNLDEFRYARFSDKKENKKYGGESRWTRWIWWSLLTGRPSEEELSPRHMWMQHQIQTTGAPMEVATWPYRHAAKVYRDMGDLKRAYAYERERRWIEIRHGDRNPIIRFFDGLFGALFGFGYSSLRAASWLGTWILLSWMFVCHYAVRHSVDAKDTMGCSIHLLQNQDPMTHKAFSTLAEAVQLAIPAPLKLNYQSHCSYLGASDWFYFFLGFAQIVGWILLTGTILTFSGVLQEKASTGANVKD